nr:hypothetical protein [Tanacetum cinerariifolium]
MPLDLGADETIHKESGDSVERAIPTDASLEIGSGDRPRCQKTTLGVQMLRLGLRLHLKGPVIHLSQQVTQLEVGRIGWRETDLTDYIPPTPYDSPLSGGHTPGSDEGEDASKQGRNDDKIEELNLTDGADIEVIVEDKGSGEKGCSNTDQGRNNDKIEELNLTDGADTEVIVEDKGSGEKGGSTVDQVSTARPEVSATTPSTPPTTRTIFSDEDLTIAQTLIKLRSEKAKKKGIAFKDADDSTRPIRSITTLQPLPTIDPKDKEHKKEKQKQEEATVAALTEEFDKFQARMDEIAVRLTHEKQEKYTIKERIRLLAEYFERRKKQLAAERVEAIRNKPPRRTQVMNRMITYLKHMGKYTHQQLKHKTLEEL